MRERKKFLTNRESNGNVLTLSPLPGPIESQAYVTYCANVATMVKYISESSRRAFYIKSQNQLWKLKYLKEEFID